MHRLRVAWLGLALIALALMGARLYLPTWLLGAANHVLARNGAYPGHIADLDLALWQGTIEIRQLTIEKRNGEVPVPFVAVPRAAGSIEWRALLFDGELVLAVEVLSPEIHFAEAPTEQGRQDGSGGHWQETVDALTPIRIHRLVVTDGRIHFHDFHSDPKVDVRLADVSLLAENLTNIRDADEPLPAHARLIATPMTAGRLIVTADFDPLARRPRFEVDAELTGMELAPWNSLLQAYAGIDAEAGTIALYAEVEAAEGRFDGYLKPFVADLDILRLEAESEEQSPLASAWEAVVGAAAELLQNQRTERLATRVPIRGSVEDPEAPFWPAFANVLRNAFVEAFAPRLEGAPAG